MEVSGPYSSTLAVLETLQLRAFRLLKAVGPLISVAFSRFDVPCSSTQFD